MNKRQENILNMSIIPLGLIVVLILGAGFLLLQDEIQLPKFNQGPQIVRLENYPTLVYSDQEVEKKRLVIKNQEELYNFLNEVDPAGLLEVKENINFNKQYLLAVASDSNPTTGYKIKVKKVYEDKEDNSLLVMLEEIEPGDTCEVTPDKNITVDIVAISKTDKKIEFDREKKTVECEAPKDETEQSSDSENEMLE